MVSPMIDRNNRLDGPALPFKLPPFFDVLETRVTHHVEDGWLVCRNAGEFGAQVDWFSEDGSRTYTISRDHIVDWLPHGRDLHALISGRPMTDEGGEVLRFVKGADGKWTSHTLYQLHDSPWLGKFDEAGGLFVASFTGVAYLTAEGKGTILLRDLNNFIRPTSILLAPDDCVYVGAEDVVLKISNWRTGTPLVERMWRTTNILGDLKLISPDLLPLIKSAVTDPEPSIREQAISTLGGVKNSDDLLLTMMADALDDPSSDVCRAACVALESQMPTQNRWIKLLASYLGGEVPVAIPLRRMGAAAIPTLLDVIQNSPLPNARIDAARIIVSMTEAEPGAVLHAMIQILSDSDPNVRTIAANATWKSSDGRLLAALESATHDSDANVRFPAIDALRRQMPASRELVERALANDAPSVRQMAVEAMAPLGKEIFPRLVDMLRNDPDPDVRREVATVLRQLHMMSPPLLEILKAEIQNEQSPVLGYAADILIDAGPEGIAILHQALSASSPAIRVAALSVLQDAHPTADQVLEPIRRILREEPEKSREAVIKTLGAMTPSETAANALLDVIESDPSDNVRLWAIVAVEKPPFVNAATIERAGRIFRSSNPVKRRELLRIFAGPDLPEAHQILIAAISSTDAETATQAISLATYGAKKSPALRDAIAEALSSPLALVREAATLALFECDPSNALVAPGLVKAAQSKDARTSLRSFDYLARMGANAKSVEPELQAMLKSEDLRLIAGASDALEAIHYIPPRRATTSPGALENDAMRGFPH